LLGVESGPVATLCDIDCLYSGVLCAALCALQEYVNLNNSDSYLMAAGAQALVSSKAGRAAKVREEASRAHNKLSMRLAKQQPVGGGRQA
jgi:hypothetical protein